MRSQVALKIDDRAAAVAHTRTSCPRCCATLQLSRNEHPHIDECGFESYSFECADCGTALIGIVDPADEALLVSESTL